jgi:hypothetical protein
VLDEDLQPVDVLVTVARQVSTISFLIPLAAYNNDMDPMELKPLPRLSKCMLTLQSILKF